MEQAVLDLNAENFVNSLKTVFESSRLKEVKEFLTKSSVLINEQMTANLKSNNLISDNIIFTASDISFLEPRGKFEMKFGEKGLHIGNKSGDLFTEWTNVQFIIQVPNSTCAKKEGEDVLVFYLKEPRQLNNKNISAFAPVLSKAMSQMRASHGPFHFAGSAADVISGLSSTLHAQRIIQPSKSFFQTSTSSTFLRCFKGVQEGVLFPLEQGILFLKPIIFHPANKVDSIVAGRGGSALTKYIDLIVETVDGKKTEFTNIDRDELPAIHGYVQHYVNMRKREAKRAMMDREPEVVKAESNVMGSSSKEVINVLSLHGEDEDSDDEDDSDFDPEKGNSDEEEGADGDNNDGSDDEDDDSEDDDSDASGGSNGSDNEDDDSKDGDSEEGDTSTRNKGKSSRKVYSVESDNEDDKDVVHIPAAKRPKL